MLLQLNILPKKYVLYLIDRYDMIIWFDPDILSESCPIWMGWNRPGDRQRPALWNPMTGDIGCGISRSQWSSKMWTARGQALLVCCCARSESFLVGNAMGLNILWRFVTYELNQGQKHVTILDGSQVGIEKDSPNCGPLLLHGSMLACLKSFIAMKLQHAFFLLNFWTSGKLKA